MTTQDQTASVGAAYQFILYEQRERIACITMNRPEVLNARNPEMVQELVDACQRANEDPTVQAVILTGAGQKGFSVGKDLKAQVASRPTGPVEKRQMSTRQRDSRAIEDIQKPVIAAINGYALGGGLELALCCDIRIAAEHAQLGLPEARRGIMPGSGGTQRLARIVGMPRALEILFTAEPISAQEAYRIGLVNKVVPYAELMAAAEEMARKMMVCAPISLHFIKEAVRKGLELTLEQGLALEADLSAMLSTTEDSKEGPRAFAEKRPPNWQGR